MPILSRTTRPISKRAATAIKEAMEANRPDMERVLQRAQAAGQQRRRDLESINDLALRESARQVGRTVR